MQKQTQRALAAALGISGAMVSKLVARGMPRDLDGARAWRAQHLDMTRLKSTRATMARPKGSGNGDPPPDLDDRYREARSRREVQRAAREGIELDRLRRRMVDLGDITRIVGTTVRVLRDNLDGIADRIANELAAESRADACAELVRGEIRRVLSGITPEQLMTDPDDPDDEA